ncbi:MAG: hypothetical protein Q4C88_08985 [Akkermansia sp.]|nr:hypothetical protein [Akkermansia sp.]
MEIQRVAIIAAALLLPLNAQDAAAEKLKEIGLKMEDCRACLDEAPVEELHRIKKELVTPEAEALGMEFLTVAETLRKQKNYYGSTALENTRIGSVIGEATDTLEKDMWDDVPQVIPLPAGGEAGE